MQQHTLSYLILILIMSLARHFFREMRPLFRVLEEPIFRAPPALTAFPRNAFFADPFFESGSSTRSPAVDLSEESSHYVVEAEVPGVKKENLNIQIGDGGHSVTIEGKTFKSSDTREAAKASDGQPQEAARAESSETSGGVPSEFLDQLLLLSGVLISTTPSANSEPSTQLSSERTFSATSSFSRTVWLPRRVDGNNVSAKLSDGILTLRIPKAEDKESVRISID